MLHELYLYSGDAGSLGSLVSRVLPYWGSEFDDAWYSARVDQWRWGRRLAAHRAVLLTSQAALHRRAVPKSVQSAENDSGARMARPRRWKTGHGSLGAGNVNREVHSEYRHCLDTIFSVDHKGSRETPA